MATRLMGVGVATSLISAIKFVGDLETMGKISVPSIIIFTLGAIVILATRKGCEEELEEENNKRSTTYHDASYPSILNK